MHYKVAVCCRCDFKIQNFKNMKDLALKILQEETNSFDMQSRLRDDVIDAMIRFTNECKQCNIQHVSTHVCPKCGHDKFQEYYAGKYFCCNCDTQVYRAN